MSRFQEAADALEAIQVDYIEALSDYEQSDLAIARGHLEELSRHEANGTLGSRAEDAAAADD